MKVLVTDGNTRAALAVTRSLGMKGWGVFVVSDDKSLCLSSASRFCLQGFTSPSAATNENAFFNRVVEIASENQVDFIVPVTDTANVVLARKRTELPAGILLAAPPYNVISKAYDKYRVFQTARKLGLSYPETCFLKSGDEISLIDRLPFDFPVVVKPFRSRIFTENGILSSSVSYAGSMEELRELYRRNRYLEYPSLIQERIEGPGTGLFTLFDGDKHLALFSHRRIREKPPSGGVGVFCESVPVDPVMAEESAALLRELRWQGIAMVEYKRDQKDGKAKLIEINGRFWGSLQLAIDCGVDFPSLLMDYYSGRLQDAEKGYLTGRKLRWFLGDLDNLLAMLRKGKKDLNLPKGYPSTLNTFINFIRWNPGTRWDVLRLSDIKPFIQECALYIRALRGAVK